MIHKVLIEFPGDNGVEQKRALMYFFTNVALKEFELVNSIPASYNEDYENYKKYKRRKDNTSDQALEIKVKKDQEKEDQERIERLQTKLKNEKQSYEKLLSEELSKYKTLEDKYLKLIIKNNNDSSELDKLEDALSYHENNIEKIENQIVIKDHQLELHTNKDILTLEDQINVIS